MTDFGAIRDSECTVKLEFSGQEKTFGVVRKTVYIPAEGTSSLTCSFYSFSN